MWHFAVTLRHVRTTGEHCTAEVRFPNNSRNASILYFTEEPTNEEDNKYRAYDHLTTLLLFVGYSRSRHSLVSSLLDAHPHMIVADESYALRKWISNADWKTVKSKYEFFDTMMGNSVRSSLYGRRSRESKGIVTNLQVWQCSWSMAGCIRSIYSGISLL